MPAPVFDLPVYGTAPNQYATEPSFESSVNAALTATWDGLLASAGKNFRDRETAVAFGQPNLPVSLGLIITLESGNLVIRGPLTEADDPLFATAPYWGMIARIPMRSEVVTLGGSAGTGAAYTASAPNVAVPVTGQLLLWTPHVINTSGIPTLAVNGGAALPVGAFAGNLGVGRLAANVPVLMYFTGSVYRTISSLGAEIVALSSVAGTKTAYTASTGSVAAYAGGTLMQLVPHVTCGNNPTISINGGAPVWLQTQDGQTLKEGQMRQGCRYLGWYTGTSLWITGLTRWNARDEHVLTAQAAARAESGRSHALVEGGRDHTAITLGATRPQWAASIGDKGRILRVTSGTRYIDLRHIYAGADAPVCIRVDSGTTAKLITLNTRYTAAGPALVFAYRPAPDAWVFQAAEGAVVTGSDAADPAPAAELTFITAGQSLAFRFLEGAGLHGLQLGLAAYANWYPSIWAIQGATGGTGLTQDMSPVYWWDTTTNGPGPAALAWKAALDAKPANQPAPAFVYWCFGQNDAADMGVKSIDSYIASYLALFGWMQGQINPLAATPIILSPVGAWDSNLSPTDAWISAVRWAEMRVVAEGTNIHLGPQYFDLSRPWGDVHLDLEGQKLQGYRLAAFVSNLTRATNIQTGPYVSAVADLDAGKRYRLRIAAQSAVNPTVLPVDPEGFAVFAAGTDPQTGQPLQVSRYYWEVISGHWHLNIVLAQASAGATVVWPYGSLMRLRSGRYVGNEFADPRNVGWGNYWPLQPLRSAAFS